MIASSSAVAPRRGISLHTQMLAGLVVGLAGGALAHALLGSDPRLLAVLRYGAEPIGQIFLRLLLMLVVPLIFSALALGVSGLGELRRIGRIGLKTLAYTVVVSTIAVVIGVALVNLVQPGAGLPDEVRAKLAQGAAARSGLVAQPPAARDAVALVVGIVPSNPVRAAADGDMLALMFFALFIGIGMALARNAAVERFEGALEGLFEVAMRLIGVVIRVAPIGVAALTFSLTARLGFDVIGQLAKYIGVVLAALAVHQFVVYSLAVRMFGGLSPFRFFHAIRDAMLMAFSTASSNATLPTALRVADEELRLPPHVSRFVLTLGATANQNGTALFEGVTVLFLAQFYGIELQLAQQVLVVFVCVLGGIGTAGVPAGSLPVVMMILGMIGVPPEGVGLILGVDRFLDMCRTTLNVTGDLAAAVVVARGETATTEA